MRSQIVSSLKGYVQIEIYGQQLEQVLNEALRKKYDIWDIRRKDGETMRLCIALRDFFRLRPVMRQTSSRLRIVARFGFPFFLDKLGKRKSFAAGAVLFVVGLHVLASLVWQVEVQGNEMIPEERILQAARQQGIYKMQWKFRLAEPDTLSRGIALDVPGMSWVGVHIEGAKITIKVVEADKKPEAPSAAPRHLVAARSAQVTSIYAEKGKPLVKTNAVVKKGDTLISGIIGEPPYEQAVAAEGSVRGIIWERVTMEAPLLKEWKVYTGESRVKYYVVFGSRALQVWGFGKSPYAEQESVISRSDASWRSYTLPLGWMKEKQFAARLEQRELSEEQVKASMLEHARAQMARTQPEAVIRSEKILHEKTENGKVYMEALFEVEIDIAQERHIVQTNFEHQGD